MRQHLQSTAFLMWKIETEKYKLSVGGYSGEVIILVSSSREKCAMLFPMFSAITVLILSAVNLKLCKANCLKPEAKASFLNHIHGQLSWD